MLKRIIFLIGDQSQEDSVYRMKENMGEVGEMVEIRGAEERGEACISSKDRSGVIFVTDSAAVLRRLTAEGGYVIALLHDNNREEDLSAAPYAISDIEELEYASFEQAYLRLAGLPWKIAETERCIIRETTVEDVDAFYHIYAEPSITRYMDRLYEDPEEEKEYIRQYIEKVYGFYGYGLWTVLDKEDGRVIGRAGVSWREGFDIPEIGFVIAVPFQHKGYAYEVCRAVLECSSRELGFTGVQALVKRGNEASASLCRRLGFTRQGTVEDRGEEYEQYIIRLPC